MLPPTRPGRLCAILAMSLFTLAGCGGGGGGSGPAPEVLLAQWQSASGGGTPTIASHIDFRLGHGDPLQALVPVGSFVGTSAIGSVLAADPGHPGFAAVVGSFSDGATGVAAFQIAPAGGGGSTLTLSEQALFATGDVAGLTPDAAGYAITRIELEVHQIQLVSPGSNPNGNGVWTDYAYDVTWRLFGRAGS